jgi:transposase
MLSFAGSLKVFVALDPCDLRKSFDGLHALVTGQLQESVTSGALFVFTNRRRTRLKILFWDRTGLWVCTKRLEQGTFSWPAPSTAGAAKLALTPEALTLLTDGVDLRDAQLRFWYQRA